MKDYLLAATAAVILTAMYVAESCERKGSFHLFYTYTCSIVEE